jgi:diaminohydroxyphosphoribosylaminopyrimidine deaminase / 5-amino-6-(5-phosphoribosylamino)uracil reductase
MSGPDDTIGTADDRFMRRALELAERGWGAVHPNPLVGAVLVRDGHVVGEGWHARFGEDHAEIRALRDAGAAARGATLYVTLEPCAHHGKTPPCTDALVAAGVARVVYAAPDPDPRAAGGALRLRSAGIDAARGPYESEARHQNHAFFHLRERGAPYVALKLALTLDGRIARAPGERTAITGPEAAIVVHRLRAGFDAIVVGSGTALADDPLLTVRGPMPPRVPPTRVVFDSELRLPPGHRLLATVAEAPVLLVCRRGAHAGRAEALRGEGADIVEVAAGPDGVDLDAALAALVERGLASLLVEGGGVLASSLLAADRVQRLHLFQAPILFGQDGVPAFGSRPARARWVRVRTTRLGADLHTVLDAG